ncbi:MAG: hypothetical protein MIL41_09790 [Hyphomicrobiales bacterium]
MAPTITALSARTPVHLDCAGGGTPPWIESLARTKPLILRFENNDETRRCTLTVEYGRTSRSSVPGHERCADRFRRENRPRVWVDREPRINGRDLHVRGQNFGHSGLGLSPGSADPRAEVGRVPDRIAEERDRGPGTLSPDTQDLGDLRRRLTFSDEAAFRVEMAGGHSQNLAVNREDRS